MVQTRNQARMESSKKSLRSKKRGSKVSKKKVKRISQKITKKTRKKTIKKLSKSKRPIVKKKIKQNRNLKKIKKNSGRRTKEKQETLNINKTLPTNSTNLEEPSKIINSNIDKVSVEQSESSQVTRYNFRKRVQKMKENPDEFKERWGVSDIKEDLKYYKEDRKRAYKYKRSRRRRNSDESFDGYTYKKTFSRKGDPKLKTRRVFLEENEKTDDEELERIKNLHPCRYDMILLQKTSNEFKNLFSLTNKVKCKIASLKRLFLFEQEKQINKLKSNVPDNSVPIYADVQNFNWGNLKKDQMELGGRLFDVIMMDPPWQLSSSQPSRGVAIGYSSLSDDCISRIPIKTIQTEGFLFIWVINAKYDLALKLFDKWGYSLVDEIVWIKRTVTGKIAKGHGFYLQHSKETCLVGFKGNHKTFLKNKKKGNELNGTLNNDNEDSIRGYFSSFTNDVIFSERRGQSQKPNEIYDIIEKAIPNGFYLEIFGRRNNLRSNWVTIGNEI